MQRLLTLLAFISLSFYTQAQVVDIADPEFLQSLIDAGVDTSGDGMIQNTEAEAVTEVDILNTYVMDFRGIQAFTNLISLSIIGNQAGGMLDVSGMSNLEVLNLNESIFSSVIAVELESLTTYSCDFCTGFMDLDLSGATSLKELKLPQGGLMQLNLTNASSIEVFECLDCHALNWLSWEGANALKTVRMSDAAPFEIDMAGKMALETFECEQCFGLSNAINFTEAINLKELIVTGAQDVYELDVSPLIKLEILRITECSLTELDVSNLTNLMTLECQQNFIEQLDVSDLVNLEVLDCSYNQGISELDVSNLNKLRILNCGYVSEIQELDISNKTDLVVLDCSDNRIQELDLTNLINLRELECSFNQIEILDITNNTNLELLRAVNNDISILDLTNASKLLTLSVRGNNINSLDLSANTQLEFLDCSRNGIVDLDLTAQGMLRQFISNENQLTDIDLSPLDSLTDLIIEENRLTELHISDFAILDNVQCYQQTLENLSVINCPNLITIFASNILGGTGSLVETEFRNLPNLLELDLSNQEILTLDITQLNAMEWPTINVASTPIQTLLIKNGERESINVFECTDLYFVCADESEISDVESTIQADGLTGVTIGSFCPHTNSGLPYRISGRNIFDGNANGCDVDDASLVNLKFHFSNGTDDGNIVAGSTGEYSIYLSEGSYTITPVLENPAYFTVEPSSIDIVLSESTPEFMQDFCIQTLGSKNDLSVQLIPVEEARPGFETMYKIVYENTGNTVQSGVVQLFYPNMLMDLVSANPTISNETGNLLFWDFQDLQPFEKRDIFFTMRINSPMDDPPVNGDDVLSFIASIRLDNDTDIDPSNNQSLLRQTVVNSFDPNDKRCLDGTRLDPELVGEYLKYMIRFENTGTATAINIVVRDSIDPVSFDINTLVPIDASHPMRTQIEGDIVEFIFEDIQLPFEDETNDGYVVFKVKTRANLVLGDVIENTAGIYFDFNFPIITNTTSTTVEIENDTKNHQMDTDIEIYPNPAHGKLYIESEHAILKLKIMDVQGRIVAENQQIATNSLQLNLMDFQTGLYIIQVFTEFGEESEQVFIEN